MSKEKLVAALQPGGALHGLTKYKQFLWFRTEPKVGTEKLNKIPLNEGGATGVFCSWEEAVERVTDWSQGGVGFAFTEEDPFFFLDVDNARTGAGWSSLASTLVGLLPGAAYEMSTSGKGFHLIGSAAYLPHKCRREDLGLEFYTEGRFVALTGRAATGDCGTVLDEGVAALISGYFPPGLGTRDKDVPWEDEADPQWSGPSDDLELLERMFAVKPRLNAAAIFSGEKARPWASFRDLFENNVDVLVEAFPTTEPDKLYGFSEADSAMADKLAYWTGCNPVRMERIMRMSALQRDKWDKGGGQYLIRTIEKAIAKCTRVEGPPREVKILGSEEIEQAWLPADPLYRGTMTAEEITARMLSEDAKSGKLSTAREAGDVGYVAWAALNNSGLSCDLAMDVCKSLVDADDVVLRSAIAAKRQQMSEFRGKPVEWERAPELGGVSRVSFADLSVDPVAHNHNDHFVDAHTLLRDAFTHRLGSFSHVAYWWEGRHWEQVADPVLRRHVGSGLNNGGDTKLSNSRITGTAAVLKDQLPMRRVLNPRSHLVFFQNCVVDAATGKTSAHAPGYDNSYLLNCDYEPEAQCPAWIAWLEDIFESDRERVQLMQEQFGWALITDNLGLHKAVVWVGVPRGGKGTALSILSRLCGDAAGAFQLSGLADDKVLSGFAAKNIVIDSDAASVDRTKSREVAGKFKTLTANEPVSVKLLYTQTPFQGELNCKLYLAANSVPNLYDDSGATANRWVPLVFDKSFLGREDTGLVERLEAEMPGVAMWALEGLRRLIERRRFTMPRSSLEELESLVESASPLVRFIDEMCVADEGMRVSDPAIWELYTRWALGHGFEPLPKKAFTEGFRQAARGLGARWSKNVMIDGKQCRGFYGIGPSGKLPPTSNVVSMR